MSEVDLYNQLQSAGLELVDCSVLGSKKGLTLAGISFEKVKIRDLIQFFVHMEQMQSAGVPLLDAVGSLARSKAMPVVAERASRMRMSLRSGASAWPMA